ncbi:MAG: hypothetical protein IPN76_22460 [Saprospiraceae bacterium]|nr:hypothetical protein [Saprospiraceae bacterium]
MNKPKIPSYRPNGIYDKDILCAYCDNEVIGKLENYARTITFGGSNLKSHEMPKFLKRKSSDGIESVIIENVDYTSYKLFLLSVLWRAHISKHSFFSNIHLGAKAEQVRAMILDNNAGDENAFEVSIIFLSPSEAYSKIIAPPTISQDGSRFAFLINQALYLFSTAKDSNLALFKKGRIAKDSRVEIMNLEGKQARQIFEKYFKGKFSSVVE